MSSAALLNGLSGINTNQFGLDSWSNNISNINTIGYKATVPMFETIMSKSMNSINANSPVSNNMGTGVTVGSNAIDIRNGTYVNSDSQLDLAIAGQGWFVIGDGNQNVDNYNYTRDGNFFRDANGNIVNSSGQYLYGVNLGKINSEKNEYVPYDTLVNNPARQTADFPDFKSDDYLKDAKIDNLNILNIPDQLFYRPNTTTKANLSLNLNNTDYAKTISSAYTDDNGVFHRDVFLQNDFNTLFSVDEQNIGIQDGDSFAIKIAGSLDELNLVAEDILAYDGVSFSTIGEFIDEFNKNMEDKGLKIGLDQNCRMVFENATEEEMYISIQTVDKDLNVKDNLMSILQFPHMEVLKPMKEHDKGDYIKNADGTMTRVDTGTGDYITDKVHTALLKVPTYETTTEIYDDYGKNWILKTRYVLQQQADETGKKDIWNLQTTVWDRTIEKPVIVNGKMIEVQGQLKFEVPNEPPVLYDMAGNKIDNFEIPFDENKISFNPAGVSAENYTTNETYKGSTLDINDVDGNLEGYLTNIDIDANGVIRLHFSNEIVDTMGRVGVASFMNEQGLVSQGGNSYLATKGNNGEFTTGNPNVLWNDKTGSIETGSILQGQLETSNVELSTALTQLMIFQRAYSANAKSITTADDVLKEAIGLKR